jgi:hypothetical protein
MEVTAGCRRRDWFSSWAMSVTPSGMGSASQVSSGVHRLAGGDWQAGRMLAADVAGWINRMSRSRYVACEAMRASSRNQHE